MARAFARCVARPWPRRNPRRRPHQRQIPSHPLRLKLCMLLPPARDDSALRGRAVGRADDLACPQCKTPNAPEAETCNACNAALREPCAACGKARRVGMIHCDLCGADGLASKIAASHRDAAQRAMNAALKDAIDELYELSNLVRAHGPELGPLASLQGWCENKSARLKANRERAQQLCGARPRARNRRAHQGRD